jgi:hypothetical protein
MRIAWRKVVRFVRRATFRYRYGYVRRYGFRWTWRRFRFTGKFRGFVRRIKCVVLRRAVKKSLKRLVRKVRKTVRKYRLKLMKYLRKYILTKRTKKLIHKRITKIFRYAKK